MFKIILMTSHYVLSENSHETENCGGRHVHHDSVKTFLYYKNILMTSDYTVTENSHYMTDDIRLRSVRKLYYHMTDNFIFAILTLQLQCH